MTSITELTLQTAPKALWKEFLAAYFDGGPHDVGAHPAVAFPRADLAFGQSRIAQPLNAADNPGKPVQTSAEIRTLCLPRNASATWHSNATNGEHLLATDQVLFQFQIRTRKARAEDQELLADQVGQLLKALLANPDTRFVLARHGITHLLPNEPVPIESKDYGFRLVNCAAQLSYPILLSDSVPSGSEVTTLASALSTAFFVRESPLIPGEYLLGWYRSGTALRAVSVEGVAWRGTTDTVLELEVNGALTGQTLTLPGGALNTEVALTASLGNLVIPANQAFRWKIISGPIIEDAAWKVSLLMRTGV